MNDLERLAAADPTENGGLRDRYRDRVIEFVAHSFAEGLLEDGKAAYWYIRAGEALGLSQLSWEDLIEELRGRFETDDEFSIIDLEEVS